ncbi:hypothetical protein PoMZ_10896 [Pyricularia oryzae]|uniref:non-reducing end alpha-L-arabinofuranosidase n=1 Tax=Pyricularia oryzae TaxID=318829 RepID=A0A4P7NJ60_PYROR|nr:hypothetical protein PoMZ_10896 [Pyricularia oryzae]
MLSVTRLLTAALVVSSAAAVDIQVKATGGNQTSGHQYGFLHEDINYSGDGGVYAELIRNRAFQGDPEHHPKSLRFWRPINSKLSLNDLDIPLSEELPTSMRVEPDGDGDGPLGFSNDGFWGMDVKVQKYTGSFWVKGAYEGKFTASFKSALTDDVFGSVEIESQSVEDDWVEHEVILTPSKDAPSSNNTFAITFDRAGLKGDALDFNLISVFPPTYKGRKNGLRIDLAEALEQLHPTFFRFPGGNMLEGPTNRSIWDWKATLGPLRHRKGFPGPWGYTVTQGLGHLEYLQWAEDMGMDIVIGVWAGLALNGDITPRDKLQPFIDDALDLIEFTRGPADSTWGKRRAELGHPEPFKLEYVEIGNEDWLAGGAEGWNSYKEYRFPMFLEAINKAYPDITVISSGSTHDGHQVPPGTGENQAMGDYHPYRKPDELVDEFDKFDNDPIPHIIGEVAATHVNGGIGWDGNLNYFPWWIGTVGEAVSMIGYERNADRIPGTFYAPVIRNMNSWSWAVTLIQHAADPAMTTRSTSWYAWEILAAHPISKTLPALQTFDPIFYVAGESQHNPEGRVWKGAVYNTTNSADLPVSLSFEGLGKGTKAKLRVLTGPEDPMLWNDPHTGVNVVNSTTYLLTAGEGGVFEFSLPELSIAVLETGEKCVSRKRSIAGRVMH